MMPNVGLFDPSLGGGFTETVCYVFDRYSKKSKKAIAAGDHSLINTNRVAAVYSFNIYERDGVIDIAPAMQAVADNAAALKAKSGVGKGGRKSQVSPVYTASIRQHKDGPWLSDEEYVSRIRLILYDSLKIPRESQILIVKHVEPQRPDEPDWHIVVNRVSPVSGKRWNCLNDFQRLQRACDEWDIELGVNFTPARRKKTEHYIAKAQNPKNRDWIPYPPNATKMSWAENDAKRAIEGEGLFEEFVAKYIPNGLEIKEWEREQFGRLRELDQIAKKWSKTQKEEALAAYELDKAGIMSGNAPPERPPLLTWKGVKSGLWEWTLKTVVEQRINDADVKRKAMWKRFYSDEKTPAGRRRNARMLKLGAENRKMKTKISPVSLGRDPEAREALLRELSNHDRRALERENKKFMALKKPPRADVKPALDELLHNYQQRLDEIDRQEPKVRAAAKAERSDYYKDNKVKWEELVEKVRGERDRQEISIDRDKMKSLPQSKLTIEKTPSIAKRKADKDIDSEKKKLLRQKEIEALIDAALRWDDDEGRDWNPDYGYDDPPEEDGPAPNSGPGF